MSLQAGVFYSSKRPIHDDAEVIPGLVRHPDHVAPASWSTEGVLLTCAGPRYACSSVGASNPHVTREAAITFDGRLDNRDDLQILLGPDAHGTSSDAALALAVFTRFGPDGLERLIGDWSLAIWNPAGNEVVLASDFAGVRPLYYFSNAERIVWSTQLKALIERIQPRELDDRYMAEFLAHGGYPDLTPYSGIYSVRPGHYLVYRAGRVELRSFWRPPTGAVVRYQRESDYEDRLRQLFQDAVRSRLQTRGSVISELSGGLDSSSVVSMAHHLIRSGSVTPSSFATLSYEHQGSLDKRFYTAVEEWSGFPGIHLSTAGDAYVSESDTGEALPAFWSKLHAKVAVEARAAGATTLMTGSLGDLVMGNWSDDSSQVARLIQQRKVGHALREALAWSKSLRMPIGGVLWRALLLLLPPRTISSRPDLFTDDGGPLGSTEDSIPRAFRTRMCAPDGQRINPAWMMARPERMKHVRGLLEMLESRRLQPQEPLLHLSYTHPYVHRPLVEFMLSIPAEIVCRPGEPRRLMRRAFRTFWAPTLNLRHSKDSFSGTFLAALRPLVPALISDVKQLQVVQRGFVDPASLKGRLERLACSLDCNEGQLRRLILLELWLRRAATKWKL